MFIANLRNLFFEQNIIQFNLYIFHRGIFVNHGYIRKVDEAMKELGYEGEELKTFVKYQEVILRDEHAARDAEREAREAEREAEREAREAAREAECVIKERELAAQETVQVRLKEIK